tara:strand:- start:235 stop:798 length:564 start_codon:yes stop_codon:yes gene_type:complete
MSLLKSLKRNFKNHHLLALLAVVVLVAGLNMYSSRKGTTAEGASTMTRSSDQPPSASITSDTSIKAANPVGENEVFAPVQGAQSSGENMPSSCTKQPVTDPADLLPQDTNSQWAQLNPGTSGDVNNVNFLNAGHFTGIDTVGASLRNANLQVRSEPPNPQSKVSPWLNSTIEPDLMRTPLEIGPNPQ